MKMSKNINLLLGQSLFETIIALAVVALLIVAIVSVTTTSVRNSTFSKTNSQATNYARAATEWLRGEKEAGWASLVARGNSTSYCLQNLDWSRTGVCTSADLINNLYLRNLSITCYINQAGSAVPCNTSNIDALEANVSVSWTDGQGTHTVSTPVLFTNFK